MAEQKKTILVVDDEARIREGLVRLLSSEGYEVTQAEHGFDALLQIKRHIPDVLISDLNMPFMSGFELLSVVRRRFPQISVIALSGAFDAHSSVPSGVIADAFYAKGQHHPEVLISEVVKMLETSGKRVRNHLRDGAPVWIPRNGRDSSGSPFVILTCPECLRSFPQNVSEHADSRVLKTPCLYCASMVQYILDFSRSVTSPLRPQTFDALK